MQSVLKAGVEGQCASAMCSAQASAAAAVAHQPGGTPYPYAVRVQSPTNKLGLSRHFGPAITRLRATTVEPGVQECPEPPNITGT